MLTSFSNEKVKTVTQLLKQSKARRQKGVFVAEGIRMVSEVPEGLLSELYLSESFAGKEENLPIIETLKTSLQNGGGPEPVLVSDGVFEKMSDTMHPQGILAVVRQPSYSMEELLKEKAGARYLILENVQDPGNVGTMIRTAEAAGASGVFLSPGCADLFNPKTVRSTMGALFRVPLLLL